MTVKHKRTSVVYIYFFDTVLGHSGVYWNGSTLVKLQSRSNSQGVNRSEVISIQSEILT